MPVLQLLPLRFVAWIKRVDLVISWHEVWGPEYWKEYLGPLGALASRLEVLTARSGNMLLVGTVDVAKQLEGMGVKPERIAVVPHAVDRDRLDSIEPDLAAPELLFVGRLLLHKRCDIAIRTLHQLRADGSDIRLGIVGVGPELGRLKDLAMACGISDFIQFFGQIEAQEDVWALMKGARLLLFPSEREGFGLTVAESLALGTPVICIEHPGNEARNLVDDGVTGAVVPEGDQATFVAASTRWLNGEPRRSHISDVFWKRHHELDWDVTAATYARLLTARLRE